MSDQFTQNITDAKAISEIIQQAIDSRIVCTMEIPGTQNSWITYFLRIIDPDKAPKLLVDNVKGLDAVLARTPQPALLFQFRDLSNIPTSFDSRIIESGPQGLLVEFPAKSQRIQRRQYFRVETPMGADITYLDPAGKKRTGVLADIGGGGAAVFMISGSFRVDTGDVLEDVWIQIPNERVQRRDYFRIGTPEGAEISFGESFQKQETAILMNFGGGGAAFLFPEKALLGVGKILKNIRIRIPGEKGQYSLELPKGVIRSIEKRPGGQNLVGIEFEDIAEKTRKEIVDYIFERQKNKLCIEVAAAKVRWFQRREEEKIAVGVEFTEIAERVRKEIIAYTFERQRSTIRKIGR